MVALNQRMRLLEIRRVDRPVVSASNQMWTFGTTIGRQRRDIQRINVLRFASERPSIPALRPALQTRRPPSVAEYKFCFRSVH